MSIRAALILYALCLSSFGLVLVLRHRGDPLSNFSSDQLAYPLSDALSEFVLRQMTTDRTPASADRSNTTAQICVGVPTKRRSSSADYLPSTLTSLVGHLPPSDRARLHVLLYFTDGAQALQDAQNQRLLDGRLADVGTHLADPSRPSPLTPWLLAQQERIGHLHHVPFILTFLAGLEQCLRYSTADRVLWLEDDVVARPDWLDILTNDILPRLDVLGNDAWSFVMLFFSEKYMYFSQEDTGLIARHLFAPAVIIALSSLALLLYRHWRFPVRPVSSPTEKSTPVKKRSTTRHLAGTLILFLLVLPFLLLQLSCGKFCLYPIAPSLSLKTERECCAQALLFSRPSAEEVLARFVPLVEGERAIDFGKRGQDDVLFELGMEGSRRGYKFNPALFQHFGDVSTYVNSGSGRQPRLRSWTFELGLREAQGL